MRSKSGSRTILGQSAGQSAGQWLLAACAWLLGLALLQRCASLPAANEWAGLLILLLASQGLWGWTRRRGRPGLALLAAGLAAALLAFVQAAWRAELRLAEHLPEAWEGRDLRIGGRIASLPSQVQGISGLPGWRFEFEVQSALDPSAGPLPADVRAQLPSRLALSWYGDGASPPPLRAGEDWQCSVRLKRPHGLMNPHGFDAEFWLFEQGLRATGLVRTAGPGAQAPVRLSEGSRWGMDALRQRLREALQRQVPDATVAGVLAALSLGDQAAISSRDWALFRNTGVSHLLSVSGLHVTMFAWLAQAVVARLWRRSTALCLRWPAPSAARCAGVAAALGYALFSGWGVPAQRTVWMLVSLALLRSLGLRWPWPMCLLASAVLVTAVDPWAIGQAGFWLSFAAVGLLMAAGDTEAPIEGARSSWRQHLRQGLRSQWVATVGLAPLSLLFFQQISVVGLLANVLAIPLVSFVITPLALAGALLPGLWWLAELAVRWLMAYLQWLAAWPWAVWYVAAAPFWAQCLGLAGGAVLVLPLPMRLRLCGLGLLLPMLWPAPARPLQGEFELLAADIGQGTAVLLRTAEHQLLYDTGPAYGPGADAGQRVLLPLMRALGVQRLDTLMLSHRDSDHVGGAASVLGGMPVQHLLSSLEDEHRLLSAAGVAARRCERGQRWVWDGVRFEILHPSPDDYRQSLIKSNAMSCVLRVTAASGRSALLTGDLESAQELALVQAEAALRSDVLLVPHHGSKTSSSAAFLVAVAPRWAMVQAGYRNRFGHPAPSVLARYQAQGIGLRVQPDCGAWTWYSDTGAESCQRVQDKRYWHALPALAQTPLGAQRLGPWPALEPAKADDAGDAEANATLGEPATLGPP
ncbi:DNA internalization-related competence protein ComEC/Rec2 [Paucibacter sp. AS339]|uniref:DNA internalization-related competence protein ComEC/Rec2 n=1 Tax=Paucibacter hankyongi TaxID=3133434 RepID=UPI0030997BF6